MNFLYMGENKPLIFDSLICDLDFENKGRYGLDFRDNIRLRRRSEDNLRICSWLISN